MSEPRTYLFSFDSESHAQVFVQKVVYYLKDVALWREGVSVRVIDGAEDDQRERLYQLAQLTGARRVKR